MRLVDADALEREGWSLKRTRQVDNKTMVYETKKPTDFPIIEPERKKGKWVHGKLIYSDISIATCTTCGKCVPVGNFCIDCGSYNGEKKRRSND